MITESRIREVLEGLTIVNIGVVHDPFEAKDKWNIIIDLNAQSGRRAFFTWDEASLEECAAQARAETEWGAKRAVK